MIKAIIATLLGAAVTAGIVYVAMSSEALGGLNGNRPAAQEGEVLDGSASSQSKIDDLVNASANDPKPTAAPLDNASASTPSSINQDSVDDEREDAATEAPATETKVMVTDPVAAQDAGTQDLPRDVKLNPRPGLVTVQGGDIEAAIGGNDSGDTNPIVTPPAIDDPAETQSSDDVSPESPGIPSRLIDEADKITEPRLRDQAYLSIVDYGITISDFDGSNEVIGKIENSEYRFTAQSNLAVAYARQGNSDGAFAIVSAIEDTQFADIVRMQVIEALSGREGPN